MTPTPKTALERVRLASQRLVYSHPHFFAMLARVVWSEDTTIDTFCVSRDLKIRFNPTFALGLPADQLIGVIAHECMHPLLDHYERSVSLGIVAQGKVIKPDLFSLWGQACDMAINSALREFQLALPSFALYPPPEYTGPIASEPIYQWLRAQQAQQQSQAGQGQQGQGQGQPQSGQGSAQGGSGEQGSESGDSEESGQEGSGQGGSSEGPKGPPQPKVGAGCLPTPGEGDSGEAPMSPAMREISEQIRSGIQEEIKAGRAPWVAGVRSRGERGVSALQQLISRIPSRTDWRQILTGAVSQLSRSNRRDIESFSRRNRRSPAEGVQIPGYKGLDPKIAVVIDCSSSMDRDWIRAIIGHCEKLVSQYPGTQIYLVTHTAEVTYQGWIKPSRGQRATLAQLYEATAHGGGTNATPAYRAVEEQKARFDYLIHFTDCEIERPWPECPARKLVIGAFGSGALDPYSAPPAGARLLPCREGA